MTLVLCAHGTRSPAGRATVAAVVEAVARTSGRPVRDAYVDVHGPALPDVLASGDTVVPLLLSRGHHADVDVAGAAARVGDVAVCPPLGPSQVLARMLRTRLLEAGLRPGHTVVLAAAGSSRPEAADHVRGVAADLGALLGAVVTPAFVAAPAGCGMPAVTDLVADAGGVGCEVAVASYLLAPGAFHDRVLRSGAAVASAPLALPDRVDRCLVDLVLQRSEQRVEWPTRTPVLGAARL